MSYEQYSSARINPYLWRFPIFFQLECNTITASIEILVINVDCVLWFVCDFTFRRINFVYQLWNINCGWINDHHIHSLIHFVLNTNIHSLNAKKLTKCLLCTIRYHACLINLIVFVLHNFCYQIWYGTFGVCLKIVFQKPLNAFSPIGICWYILPF